MSLFDFCYKKLIKNYSGNDIEDSFGLVLVFGLGLVLGLVFGLDLGLVLAFVLFSFAVAFFAFVTDLVDNKKLFGLFYTFGFLIFILTFFSLINFLPLLFFAIPTLVLTEIFFWTSKLKPKAKKSTFWFMAKRKIAYLLESAFLVIEINGAYYAIKTGIDWLGLNQETINAILCFVGWGTASIIIIAIVAYGWIKVNELKYKKEKIRRNKK